MTVETVESMVQTTEVSLKLLSDGFYGRVKNTQFKQALQRKIYSLNKLSSLRVKNLNVGINRTKLTLVHYLLVHYLIDPVQTFQMSPFLL